MKMRDTITVMTVGELKAALQDISEETWLSCGGEDGTALRFERTENGEEFVVVSSLTAAADED